MTDRKLLVKKMSKLIIQETENQIMNDYGFEKLGLKVKLDSSETRKRSWGGIRIKNDNSYAFPFIDITITSFIKHDNLYIGEYSHFSNDKEIGSYTGDWWKCLIVLITHEMAHVVEKMYNFFGNSKLDILRNKCRKDHKDHDEFFREIYRNLRNKMMNKFKKFEDISKHIIIKKKKENEIIGEVYFENGLINGKEVTGKFPLIKKYKSFNGGPDWHGFVTIEIDGNMKRVKVFKDSVKYIS